MQPRLGGQRSGSRFTSGRFRTGHVGHGSGGAFHHTRYGYNSFYGHRRFLGSSYHFGLHSTLFWPRTRTWGAYGLGFRFGGLSYANYGFGFGYGGGFGLGYGTAGFGVGLRYGGFGFGGLGYGCGYPYFSSYYAPRAFWWPSNCYYPSYGSSFVSVPVFYPSGGSSVVLAGSDAGAGEIAEEEVVVEPTEDADTEALALERTVESHLRLGDFYFREGRYDEAAESYLRAIAYAPEDGSIHFVASDALFAQGDYHYAAYMIRRALELDPGLATVDLDKRTFYENPDLFSLQLSALQSYLEEKRFDAAAHLVHGYNLRFSGRPDRAAQAFERVLEIEPGNEAAELMLAGLRSLDESGERPTVR